MLSFDAFAEQQKILLDGQARALEIQTNQMEKILVLTTTAADKSYAMLQLMLQAAADLAAQAVSAADAARERAKEAHAESAKATADSVKDAINPLLNAAMAWAKEKGFVQ